MKTTTRIVLRQSNEAHLNTYASEFAYYIENERGRNAPRLSVKQNYRLFILFSVFLSLDFISDFDSCR